MIALYGIKNCDTMKKAFAWLEAHKVAYRFHDYKKDGVDRALIQRAIAAQGWEAVLNRKGTIWRQLPDAVKAGMDNVQALDIALANPSIIRRPLLVQGEAIVFGFDAAKWEKLLT